MIICLHTHTHTPDKNFNLKKRKSFLHQWGSVQDILTFMVRSPEAETMYFSSKSTTLTAARWPTRTLRKLISEGEFMSQTAIDRSLSEKEKKKMFAGCCEKVYQFKKYIYQFVT